MAVRGPITTHARIIAGVKSGKYTTGVAVARGAGTGKKGK